MKNIKYLPILLTVLFFSSCEDEFLEREQLFEQSSESYYQNPVQINSGLAAAYSRLAAGGNGNPILFANMMSDDCFGGGGDLDERWRNTDGFKNTISSQYEEFWQQYYAGILRANIILEKIDDVEYANIEEKNQVKGEAYFLRAYFHFKLTQFFGKITIKTSSEPGVDKQASIDEIYDVIASDLKNAIEIMPDWGFKEFSGELNGHASKYAAQAQMARVFLFYTGYHNKTEIALSDGSSITKTMVIDWIDDCIENSGYELVSDFRNLWPIASKANDTLGGLEYPYARDAGLDWAGDGNIETVFALKFSIYGNASNEGGDADNPYASSMAYCNQLALFMGLRGHQTLETVFPYAVGYGACPVNPQLYDSYDNNDLRKMGTICNVQDPNEGLVSENYTYNQWSYYQETGYQQKKYLPITTNTENGLKGMYTVIWGEPDHWMRESMQDEILIRFADVILMAAELKEDVGLLNMVRTRAGLDPLGAYTLEALQQERRHELALEGLRFHDMLRWGIVEQELAKVKDVPTYSLNVPVNYTASYRPLTKGLLPIPESQIAISNGGLVQNPGW